MNLVSLDGISKSLGEGTLFENASLGIDEGDRIGFVGRNGRGKSTFLRILTGALEPDSGSLARKRDLAVSILEQRPGFRADESVADFLYGGDSSLVRLAREYRVFVHGESLSAASRRELELLGRAMEERGGFDLERSYESICTELGLPDMEAPMGSLSGGMVRKASMARALAPRAELLLLDEPTNHLDIETIEWLERRLLQANFAFLLVTHDRWFLDSVCTAILEIDRNAVWKYPGDYSDYLARRLEREASLEKAESRRLTILKRELAWLGRGARARATKSERRKDSIRDMQASGLEREKAMDGFSTGHRRLGKKILELHGVSKSYGDMRVLAPFTRIFKAGERLGLVGPNGSGKTTFLDIVAGRTAPDSGRVDRGENTVFAYFDQTAAELDMEMTVIGFVESHAELVRMGDGSSLTAEQLLERFLFPRAVQGMKLSRLSGGELRRIQLVRLLAESPNFLLLDEPTNDLDIDTIELLEDFLSDFPGCVIVVSHDRAFLDRTADFLLVLDGEGGVREFIGGWSDYRAFGPSVAQRASSAPARPAPAAVAVADPLPAATVLPRRKLGFAERREFECILDEITALEEEKTSLEILFSSASSDPAALAAANRRYSALGSLIDAKTARWEDLAQRAES
jgi:ATP-binding cassette subfamily F protein uup